MAKEKKKLDALGKFQNKVMVILFVTLHKYGISDKDIKYLAVEISSKAREAMEKV